MNRSISTIAVAVSLALASTAFAQAPPQTPAATPPPAGTSAKPQPAAPGAPAPPPAPVYTYSAEGRRDPFISLSGRGTDGRSTANRLSGLPGQLINELSLKGIVKDSNGFYALVQGGDTKTYTIRVGDRLLDGTVKAITADAVVFSQDVNDPLSLQKQREIRKSLRPGEESRG
jgi:Tfp pilus assembly protein PilP